MADTCGLEPLRTFYEWCTRLKPQSSEWQADLRFPSSPTTMSSMSSTPTTTTSVATASNGSVPVSYVPPTEKELAVLRANARAKTLERQRVAKRESSRRWMKNLRDRRRQEEGEKKKKKKDKKNGKESESPNTFFVFCDDNTRFGCAVCGDAGPDGKGMTHSAFCQHKATCSQSQGVPSEGTEIET